MYIRAFSILLLLSLIVYLVRRFRPTAFGTVFGLFCLYLPLHLRIPLAFYPLVNGITGFLVLLTLLLPGGSGPMGRRTANYLTLVFIGWILSVVGVFIALKTDPEAGEVLVLYKRWLDPVLFGILALALVREQDRRFTVSCMMIGVAMVSVQLVREGIDLGPNKRALGLLGQSNMTGAFLAMYSMLLFAAACLYARGLLLLALLGVVLLAGWGLVFTESRAAMLGYAGGIIATLFASRRPFPASLGLLVAMAMYFAPDAVLPERVINRFEATRGVDSSDGSLVRLSEEDFEPSAAGRLRNWSASLNAMASNPLGFGFGQFKSVIARFGGIQGLDAHNIFLLLGVELGILGLFFGVAFFLKLLTDVWGVWRDAVEPFTRVIGTGVLAMVVPALVVNFFGSRLMDDQTSTYLWILAGMTARLRDLVPAKATAPLGASTAPPPVLAAQS